MAGRDLRELNPLWLRDQLAVVSQDAYLPLRTVRENLLYGREDATEEEVRRALRAACCDAVFHDRCLSLLI